MALPKVIQDQLDQVEQFEQGAATAQATGDTSQTGSGDSGATETVVETTQAQTQAEPDHRRVELSDSEIQRLKTIEGKYSAEVPRLHTTLREQETALGAMRRELEEMRAKVDEARQQTTEKVVTTKDDEVFGADLTEMVRRVAGDEFKRMSSSFLADVDRRLVPLREQMGQVTQAQAVSEEDKFWARLTAAVPDWETINAGESWQRWLGEFDPVAGVTRQAALDQAQGKLDSARVAAMFNLFKSQDPEYTRATTAAGQSKSRQQELSRQVAPSKTKASAPAPQGEKIWTQEEFLAAMDPRQQAAIGYEAWVRLQEEADKAYQEGRVK